MNARSSSNKPLLRLNSSCSNMQQHCGMHAQLLQLQVMSR